uniref:Asparagine synthetase domain-containing protein n=1 Tax=Arcella intermedia TaxID=1963864 RepID=A0A6B2L675_9EUKA
MVAKAYDPSYLRAVKYWDLDFEEKGSGAGVSEEEAKRRVRELLEESIRLRLRADVPVSVYLSGGLDSCTTLALSAHLLHQAHPTAPLDAFTISFPEHHEYDEASIAERFSKLHNTKFHKIPLKQDEMVNYFEEATFHAESFNSNMNYLGKYALSRELRGLGYKVALSGEGSDEIFLGYPFFKKHLLDGWEAERKERFLERLLGDNKLTKSAFGLDRVPTEMDKECLASELQVGTKEAFCHVPQFNVLLEVTSRFLCPEVIHKMRGCWDACYNDTYLWMKTLFPSILLGTFGDRMEMANSIEVRTPFLDHKLVEYVTKLPAHLKIKIDEERSTMIEKYILRESVKELLHAENYQRLDVISSAQPPNPPLATVLHQQHTLLHSQSNRVE